MPYYDYKCKKCGKQLYDIKKSIKDETKQTCPECGEIMEILINNSYFQLKGGGWFKDGYTKKK